MKRLIFLALGLVLFGMIYGCATPATPDQLQLIRVIEVPNQTKDQLYIKTNNWFVETFRSAESVIEFSDKESGSISGKYVGEYTMSIALMYYKVFIGVEIKDNKVRATIKNPLSKYQNPGDIYPKNWIEVKDSKTAIKLKSKWEDLISDLENYLKNDSDDNW